MKNCATLLLILCAFFVYSEGIKNYIGTDIQKCINCLCHARTGCYSRMNCAKYSVKYEYWKQAGGPVVNLNDLPLDWASYEKCMKNENCIISTIVAYTESFGKIDCNCDGVFDCKDRAAIHLFGKNCVKPKFGAIYSKRFNTCVAQINTLPMYPEEGGSDCFEVHIE